MWTSLGALNGMAVDVFTSQHLFDDGHRLAAVEHADDERAVGRRQAVGRPFDEPGEVEQVAALDLVFERGGGVGGWRHHRCHQQRERARHRSQHGDLL
jgi:hypothetical protein